MSQPSKKVQPTANPSGEQRRMHSGSVPGVGSMGVSTTSTGPHATNLDTLRKIAEAATPGPWETLGGQGPFGTHAVCHRMEQGTLVEIAYRDAHFDKANAVHIATFNPETVLALLTRLEQAEQAVARVRMLHSMTFYDKWGRSSLEPVGHGGWCSICGRFDGASCDTIRALDGDTRG